MRLPRPPSREAAVLGAVAFAVAVGFGVVAPAIPEFARTFGVDRTAAAGVVSVFAFMRLVSALLGGRLVDRLGERRVLATGIAIVAVSSALAGAAQSYIQLLLLRGAGGVGSAMFTVAAFGLLLRSVGPDQRGAAMGTMSGAFLLGGILGPALGSAVSPLGLRAPFYVYSATLAVAGTIGLRALPRGVLGTAEENDVSGLPLREALGLPAYRAALGAHFADTWAVLGVRTALLPLFVVEGLRANRAWVGIGFAIVAVVNGLILFPAARWSDARGRRPVLVGGTMVAAFGLLALAASSSLPAYVLALMLLGLGSGMLDVAPGAVVGDIAHGRSGYTIALYQMAGDAGLVVGPLVAGLLADQVSYSAAFAVTAGVLGVAALLAFVSPETRTAPEA